MKEPVFEDHLQQDARRALGQLRPVDASCVKRRRVVDLQAPHALEGQDAGGSGLPEHPWDVDLVIGGKIGGEALGAPSFLYVVELGAQGQREFLCQADQVIALRDLPTPARGAGHRLQDVEVLLDLLDHSWTPYLDYDLGAIGQRRHVRLSDGRRRQRQGVQAGKRRFHRPAQLFGDDLFHRAGGQRTRVVLQLGQLSLVIGWQ